MKNLIMVCVMILGSVAVQAKVEGGSCDFLSHEKELKAGISSQIIKELGNLAENGSVDYNSETLVIKAEKVTYNNYEYTVSGSFESTLKTPFIIYGSSFADRMTVSATWQADGFDKEGNPINGICVAKVFGDVYIVNKKSAVVVDKFKFAPIELYKY